MLHALWVRLYEPPPDARDSLSADSHRASIAGAYVELRHLSIDRTNFSRVVGPPDPGCRGQPLITPGPAFGQLGERTSRPCEMAASFKRLS